MNDSSVVPDIPVLGDQVRCLPKNGQFNQVVIVRITTEREVARQVHPGRPGINLGKYASTSPPCHMIAMDNARVPQNAMQLVKMLPACERDESCLLEPDQNACAAHDPASNHRTAASRPEAR